MPSASVQPPGVGVQDQEPQQQILPKQVARRTVQPPGVEIRVSGLQDTQHTFSAYGLQAIAHTRRICLAAWVRG